MQKYFSVYLGVVLRLGASATQIDLWTLTQFEQSNGSTFVRKLDEDNGWGGGEGEGETVKIFWVKDMDMSDILRTKRIFSIISIQIDYWVGISNWMEIFEKL